MDSGSPQLALLAAGGGGGTINSGAIDLVQFASGQARYLRINLTNILISSYSQSSGGGVPSESVSLAPLMISWNYTFYEEKPPGCRVGMTFTIGIWPPAWETPGTNQPAFVSTGIRSAAGVQLGWIAINAGQSLSHLCRGSDLSKPFVAVCRIHRPPPVASLTTPSRPRCARQLFYTVEEVPGRILKHPPVRTQPFLDHLRFPARRELQAGH